MNLVQNDKISENQNWSPFAKSARFHVPKNGTSGAETKKTRPLFVANYPPKWCRTRLFYAFIKQTSFKIQFYIGIKVTSFDFQQFYHFGPNSSNPIMHSSQMNSNRQYMTFLSILEQCICLCIWELIKCPTARVYHPVRRYAGALTRLSNRHLLSKNLQ